MYIDRDATAVSSTIPDLSGKVVLITGAARGGGRIVAEAFAQHGAWVAVNDISPVNLEELVQLGGGRIRPYVEDVAKKVGVQALIKQVEDDFGQIDVLINHASVEPHAPLLDMDEWDWHRALDVNLTAAFLMMQSVGRVMRVKGSGTMVNLIRAKPPRLQGQAAYHATMTGLIALTCAAASEFKPLGVHVHAVGNGMAAFEHRDSTVPADLIGAVMFLSTSEVYGQIVNVKDE